MTPKFAEGARVRIKATGEIGEVLNNSGEEAPYCAEYPEVAYWVVVTPLPEDLLDDGLRECDESELEAA